jgi:hypothetical protein
MPTGSIAPMPSGVSSGTSGVPGGVSMSTTPSIGTDLNKTVVITPTGEMNMPCHN